MSNLPPSDGMPSSFDSNAENQSTPLQRFGRKLLKEPLIPIGCIVTVAAFINATRAIRKGDHHQAQRMFRARVLAQGFTIMAIVGGGIYLADDRKKERQQWALERQQKQQAETEKWVKELEARDAEDKALRERIARRKELRKATGAAGGVSDEAAEAELEAQLVAAAEREARAQAAAAGGSNGAGGGGVLAALGGLFGGGRSKKDDGASSPATPATAPSTEPEAEAEAGTSSQPAEFKKGVRKSHGRSQLDTLGDLFGKRGSGADGEEKK
ncbi:hypothetical protein HMPREF1624_05271 [Sporothrix schenckii ATCC 58251]|uniref:HIG1 domain-containing protein n=1 Tax=Sporothrix schenckii (strain ATCC 58251 / de Perez 2211183) TaxID=1391915 RepID=U7PSC9_SPOS1|nr:hypothetical protein HMPREF1624_05271 [Sporothrix schenckii ATCC 58251]